MSGHGVKASCGVLRSAALAPVLLAAALSWWPGSAATAQAPYSRVGAGLEAGVDPGIRPGDDFFAFANGSWLKATEIPAGKERWSVRNDIDELTRQQVTKLLDDAVTAPAGSNARKVADFRAAYLNEAAIEARGLAPIKDMLDNIDRVGDKAALTRLLGSGLGVDVDPLNWGIFRSSRLLGLSVEQGIRGEKTNVAFLLQGGLGLPDREHYVSQAQPMKDLRAKYQQYIGGLFALAGYDRPDQRAESVMALEVAMAEGQATREASANDHNADSIWTRADFASKAPGMDWSAFFSAAGLAGQKTFVAWQPGAVRRVAALVGSEALPTWKDYLRFHLIDRYAEVLPRAFAEQAQALRGAVAGQPQPTSRAQRAFEATRVAMSGAIGRMYAERHFPASQKARVNAIVANVRAAFLRRVETATWMSPAARTTALTKLKALYVGIGYPEQWQDYSGLMIDSLDAVGNVRRVEDQNYRRMVARLGKPVDPTEWWLAPQTPNGILIFQLNAYEFSAALLQAPKFDPTASEAASYGAIGSLIAHDVSHFVDMLGKDYDTDGREHRWWTPEDSSRFEAASAPLVSQFSEYHPFPDVGVNGKLSRSENIADLAGLSAAFDAYRLTLGNRITDKEYVRQQDREFFIGFARSLRARISDAGMRTQAATNDHAPENYRVATVRNLDAWYEAFDVGPGQKLYLEPSARVRVW